MRLLKLGKLCETLNLDVEISEDRMEKFMNQGLKLLRKRRNILEVSRYRQRKW